MARMISPGSIILKSLAMYASAAALVCAPAGTALAQHGGGGGGHFGGGGHASAPHVSAPPAAHPAAAPHVSSPGIVHFSGPPAAGAGAHGFVAVPPAVHLIPPPGSAHPVLGGHVVMPVTPPTGHTVIGYPDSGKTGVPRIQGGGALSFSGEGRSIWQEPPVEFGGRVEANGAASGGAAANGNMATAQRQFPRRPIFPHPVGPHPIGPPVFPIFGGPGFGFGFGVPFFGLGMWGGTCGPYWGGGFGCNGLPYYSYGYGYGLGPAWVEAETAPEQNGPQMYENAPTPAPLVYGGGERQLVDLYLKDGSVYDVTDYWLVDNDLHFTTVDERGNQTEHVIAFDDLDVQKTINVNTDRGFRFVLRNEPMQEYLQGTEQNGVGAGAPGPEQPQAPPSPNEPPGPPQP